MRLIKKLAGVGAIGLLGTALLLPTTAAVAAIEGEFAGQVDSELLFLDAANLGALSEEAPAVAQIGVAPTQAQVNVPDGLGGGVLTRGAGFNLDPSLLGEEVPLQLSMAEQTAPPDNTEPVVEQLIPLNEAAPLLTGSVSESTAWARDPAALECPTNAGERTMVSEGTSTTTDLGILDTGDGVELISVASQDGTLTASSDVYVGSEGEVIGEAVAQTAAVNIADELVIDVSNPILTATATGVPGTASVEYTGEVRVNGEKIAGTQENQISLEALADILIPLDEMVLNEVFGPVDEVLAQITGPISEELPILDPITPELLTELVDSGAIDLDAILGLHPTVAVTAGQLVNVDIAADGTHASGEVAAVSIDLNLVSTLLETEVPIVAFDLAPMAASADAPPGGLDCGGEQDPFSDVHKDVTAAKVRPGTTFDYAITVPNTAECTVTDVTVTDVITGPDGFEIVSTQPPGTVDGGTITWEVDSIEPNEVLTFLITVSVPETAQAGEIFNDRLTVTGTCDGQPVSGNAEVPLPVVTTETLLGCDVSPSNKSATHLEVMPGQAFSYLIHAYNAGDEDCGPTTVTDTLPDGVTFVSCAPDCTVSDRTVVFQLDNLAAGESVELTITVTAPDSATSDLTNTATIDPANGDPATVTTDIPDVTDRSVLAPPDPADFEGVGGGVAPDTPEQQLPRTGGGLALLGLGALAVADRLRRRR